MKFDLHVNRIINVLVNDDSMFLTQGIHISSNDGEELKIQRQSFKQLELSRNHTWLVSFATFKVRFPYGYDFAACLAEVSS